MQDGRPDRLALLEVYLTHLSPVPRPVLAGDHTAWPRLNAYSLHERTVEHQPIRLPQAKPITLGQGVLDLGLGAGGARELGLAVVA